MKEMITNTGPYNRCSRNAEPSVKNEFTWTKVGNTITEKLFERFPEWDQ